MVATVSCASCQLVDPVSIRALGEVERSRGVWGWRVERGCEGEWVGQLGGARRGAWARAGTRRRWAAAETLLR